MPQELSINSYLFRLALVSSVSSIDEPSAAACVELIQVPNPVRRQSAHNVKACKHGPDQSLIYGRTL